MANMAHAILGKVKRPTAKELIVLPKPGNFTIARPTAPPMPMEIKNPAASLHSVTTVPSISE